MTEVAANVPKPAEVSRPLEKPVQEKISITLRAKELLQKIWRGFSRKPVDPDATLQDIASNEPDGVQTAKAAEVVLETPPQKDKQEFGEGDAISISKVIAYDLNQATNGKAINGSNVGGVLARLRSQAEKGISLKSTGIKVSSSMTEVLPEDLLRDSQTGVICHNEPIPREEDQWGNKLPFFEDKVLGRVFDGDAYDRVLELHKSLYGDKANVKLVRHNNNLIIVAEHQAGDRIKITQVLDCDFPQTSDYREFQRKVDEENVDPATWQFGQSKKENYIPAHHLVIEDIQSAKLIDLRSLLPNDWSLRYIPIEGLGFSQESDGKYLKYSEITSPELLVAALHEYGHSVVDANNDRELYQEAKGLWIDSKFTTGGPRGLPQEVFERTKALLVQNERGASAHAFQVLCILHKQGLNLGVPINRVIDITNDALASYERGYSGGQTRFTRLDIQKRTSV